MCGSIDFLTLRASKIVFFAYLCAVKRLILIIIAFAWFCFGATAQKKEPVLAPSYAWKLVEPLGLREPATIDTLPDNYAQRFVPSFQTPAYATTGNYGAEGIDMIWSGRPRTSDFFFRDGLLSWIPTEKTMRFYNTRTPMTLLSYSTAGGRDNAQERLGAIFSGNINSKAQIGALLDYIYSKGCYANQADKGLIWGVSGSYLGDRYEMQAYYNHYNLLNKENGGIDDPLYITDPALVQGGVTKVDPKTIPTRLSNAHTRVSGEQLLINNRYKIGFWHEETEGDSIISREYVPVTSVIYTLKYTKSKHMFRDTSTDEMSEFFTDTYLNPALTDDRTSYWSLENTVGLSLLEGFHKYAKFGLAAFVTYEMDRFTQTADTIDRAGDETLTPFPENISIAPKATEHKVRVGAQLTKQKGSVLRYAATAQFGVAGATAGDININGNIDTRIPLPIDTIGIRAFAAFSNEATPYLLRNYLSNHFIWQNNFGKERRLLMGGRITVPRTGTSLTAQVENIQNHVFFGPDFIPMQHGGSVQVFSANLSENLRLGPFNWDTSVTYQTTSDAAVIALPQLAIYTNIYFKFHIATLKVQMGVDCDYYTRYFAPKYQPATASFANQTEIKLGNYPFMNVYANFKLSKTRFFVMMSHINQGWFSHDYFSLPDYPLNPRRFQIGLSVDFAN